MVGVRRQDLRAAARWFGALSARARAALSLAVVVLIGLIVWAQINSGQRARMVRMDPDGAAANPAIMKFALGRGHAIFEQRCASCHGKEGQGSYTMGAANLTDRDWLYGEGTASDIETVVLYGIRARNSRTFQLADMPAFGTAKPYSRYTLPSLSPGDISDVIQYLFALERRKAEPAAARRGAQVYAGRGNCFDCHGPDANGDPAIGAPNLTDAIWLYGDGSTKWIYDSIARGRAGVCPAWVGRLSAVEIREVSLFVYAISHGSSQPKPSVQ